MACFDGFPHWLREAISAHGVGDKVFKIAVDNGMSPGHILNELTNMTRILYCDIQKGPQEYENYLSSVSENTRKDPSMSVPGVRPSRRCK